VDGRRIEHWHAARAGGERAALSMLGRPLPAPRAPWVFTEVAGDQLDVVGWAPEWDETVTLGETNAHRCAIAVVASGQVRQVAVVNGAIPVESARAFVERAPGSAELAELDALRAAGEG